MRSDPVIIIGGGLSGLCCARQLHAAGVEFLLLEAGDVFGGRVRTDRVNGFQLDHGFQVLQTAYPEARRQLDYTALKLSAFEPGALIRTREKVVCISDPWRRPGKAWITLANGIGTLTDRWKLAKLRHHVVRDSEESLWEGAESTTEEFLRSEIGLSADMLERFFRPWFSGVFFEDRLVTSSKFFRFVFRMFALGDVALPASGMSEIPRQLAGGFPAERMRLSSRVETLEGQTVRLASGEVLQARAIVVAVEGPEASRLSMGRIATPTSCATACLYFAAPESPLGKPYLLLNGDRTGPINNLCVPSDVAPSYAPSGQSLVSVSLLGTKGFQGNGDQLETDVRRQLTEWFGGQVEKWEPLHSYFIPHALPGQAAPAWRRAAVGPRLADGLYCCGDYCETASIQGAMLSGRQTAEAVTADLKSGRGV